jgi:dihydropyrimidinase
MQVQGEVVSVLSRGQFVIRDREFVGQAGAGRYLKRVAFARP